MAWNRLSSTGITKRAVFANADGCTASTPIVEGDCLVIPIFTAGAGVPVVGITYAKNVVDSRVKVYAFLTF